MSRKDKKEVQEATIRAAVKATRESVQSAYALQSGSIKDAIAAGQYAIVEAASKNPEIGSSIVFFCEQEIERLREAMQIRFRQQMQKSEGNA